VSLLLVKCVVVLYRTFNGITYLLRLAPEFQFGGVLGSAQFNTGLGVACDISDASPALVGLARTGFT
jgi:hypothetical protein